MATPGILAALLAAAVLVACPTPATANLRAPPNSKLPVEAWLTTAQLISHWGYPSETHTVRTEDGFFIEVHRIAGGRGQFDKPAKKRAPVLFAHGFGATSECMVLRANNSLSFMMADAGLDVWLGNTRGSFYGKKHESLSPSDAKFWDYSWHENGVYDMRAIVDYIIEVTKEPSVMVVGHSMGSTSLYALLSERPDYNDKIRAGFLLAPAVYFFNLRGTFAQGKKQAPWAPRAIRQLRAENPFTKAPYPQLCYKPNGIIINPGCITFFAQAQGPFYNSNNNGYLAILLRHWPGGTSIGQLNHFIQLIVTGLGFRKYDYGPEKNRARYGVSYPPAYNISNVRAPMFIFYCENDYQAHYKDIKRLAADTPGTAGLFLTPAKTFNHLDIMYEEDAAELIYKRLIEQALKYNSS